MLRVLAFALISSLSGLVYGIPDQLPLVQHADSGKNVSAALFFELEEHARIVDISYCVGTTGLGIHKPFTCLSRCTGFPDLELVTTWNTGSLASDSCGYIALDHGKQRILVAFRGTYSIANTIVDLSTIPQEYVPYPGSDNGDGDQPLKQSSDEPDHDHRACLNCTVHMGFQTAWSHTSKIILPELKTLVSQYPHFRLNLIGHSLGGAVAALAALDFEARGWDPVVTTFGEPRIGNARLAEFIDGQFRLGSSPPGPDTALKYRRVTHVDDPVPLLPLSEWGYAMHAGEIYISKYSLSPDMEDLHHCQGDYDSRCIAGQDSTVPNHSNDEQVYQKRDLSLLASVTDEIQDLKHNSWVGIPARYKLWQLFFAHRDYFWRIGLCTPGGDPTGGGGKFKDPIDR